MCKFITRGSSNEWNYRNNRITHTHRGAKKIINCDTIKKGLMSIITINKGLNESIIIIT